MVVRCPEVILSEVVESDANPLHRLTELEPKVVITWVFVTIENIVEVVVMVVKVAFLVKTPLLQSSAAGADGVFGPAEEVPQTIIEVPVPVVVAKLVVTETDQGPITVPPLPTRVIMSSEPRLLPPDQVFQVPPVPPSLAVFS